MWAYNGRVDVNLRWKGGCGLTVDVDLRWRRGWGLTVEAWTCTYGGSVDAHLRWKLCNNSQLQEFGPMLDHLLSDSPIIFMYEIS